MGCPRRTSQSWVAIFGILLGLWLAPTHVAWSVGPASSSTTHCLLGALHELVHENELGVPEPRSLAPLKIAASEAPVATQARSSREKLSAEIAKRRARVPEFRFIREEAERRGLRVWLFGGTAAGYSHYVKWDVLRELGDLRFQPNRFDYDYTNIYRSTQDLDIVVSGNAREAEQFEQALKQQFPYFLGTKSAGWEVRSIKEARGDKGGLLGDFGFMNQHTDSNSTGMVELTDPPRGESIIRDIRDWENNKDPAFLKDVDEGRLTFYHSPRHQETSRFKSGQNPPIFSVIRALTKAFQYDLKINGEDLAILQKEIAQFDPARDLANPDAERWIEKNGKKLFQHAVDIEYAWDTLEKLGLRKKLIAIHNDSKTEDSLTWWMNKEPLRSKAVGEGDGATAESLGIKMVSHETKSFLAYESMTRSHTGVPNVFVSRKNTTGEEAVYGEVFYTSVGNKNARGTGITIRYEVDPKAREGSDFAIEHQAFGERYFISNNRNAIRVIPESLDMSPGEYFKFLAEGNKVDQWDQAILWKLKRRIENVVTSRQIPPKDMKEIHSIVVDQIRNAPNRDVVIQEWLKVEGARLRMDPAEVETLSNGLKAKSYQVDPAPLFLRLTELTRGTELERFVTQEWLPSIIQTLKPDIGDRALERSLFSSDPKLREFATKVLAARDAKASTAFVRALRRIEAQGGDVKVWLKSETRTTAQAQDKSAYLALHPELRQTLAEAELRVINPYLERVSNLPVFEKIAGGRLPTEAKSESFEFTSFDFPAEGKRVKLGSPWNERGRMPGEEDFSEVTLSEPFEMQVTPVTQLQWSLVMGENPSRFKTGGKVVKLNGQNIEMNPDRPVEQVSWMDVQEYIRKLSERDPKYNYRLPTEAEWEYAVRAGTDTPYSYGSDAGELGAYAWYNDNSGRQTHDVAGLKPNPNGLYDMYGNVWEWVQDWWRAVRPPHSADPKGPLSGSSRVQRGGSWVESSEFTRSALRHRLAPYRNLSYLGFRLVRTPK